MIANVDKFCAGVFPHLIIANIRAVGVMLRSDLQLTINHVSVAAPSHPVSKHVKNRCFMTYLGKPVLEFWKLSR